MWVEEVETCLAITLPSTNNTIRNRDTSAAVISDDGGPLQLCYEACTANINTMIKLLQVKLLYTVLFHM
jgi:hypothetical protein